jgi:hypothetical protein
MSLPSFFRPEHAYGAVGADQGAGGAARTGIHIRNFHHLVSLAVETGRRLNDFFRAQLRAQKAAFAPFFKKRDPWHGKILLTLLYFFRETLITRGSAPNLAGGNDFPRTPSIVPA